VQPTSKIVNYRSIPANTVNIERVEIRLVRLPLNEPFETSFGRIDSRLIFLVRLDGDGFSGWGEVVAEEEPRYSYETVGTAHRVILDHLAPAILSQPIADLDDLAERFAKFRGHNMAKAGLELAYMDLLAQVQGRSLSKLIEGTRETVPVGVEVLEAVGGVVEARRGDDAVARGDDGCRLAGSRARHAQRCRLGNDQRHRRRERRHDQAGPRTRAGCESAAGFGRALRHR